MARNTKFRMQAIDQIIPNINPVPGITTPQINYGVSIGGKDRPQNGATAGADWLSSLTNIPADLFYKLIDTIDNVADGAIYAKVLATDISEGHIILSSVDGTMDDIDDGATYGRVLLTGISAGQIVLAQVDGDLDDIADGTNFGKVSSTNISAGNIVLQVDQNLSTQGIKIITASSGARVELFPDANTGINILDDAGAIVFRALVGGADVGDVQIGNYSGGQGLLYDKSTGTIKYKNVEWSEVVDDDGNIPDDNADVTADNPQGSEDWLTDGVELNQTADLAIGAGAGQSAREWHNFFFPFYPNATNNDFNLWSLSANWATSVYDYYNVFIHRSDNQYLMTSGVSILKHGGDYSTVIETTFAKNLVVDFFAQIADTGVNHDDFGFGFAASASPFYDGHDRADVAAAAFTSDGTDLYAHTSGGAGGADHTETLISGVTITDKNQYRIEFTSGSNAKFYVNGVLKATITTTLPSSGNVKFGCGQGDADLSVGYLGMINFSVERA